MTSVTASSDRDQPTRLSKWEWERAVLASNLRRPVRHLLLTLAVYMGAHGEDCFPSAETIGKGMGVERATVFGLLKEARESGWLEIESKGGAGTFGRGGTGMTNRYLPRVPASATVQILPTVADGIERTNRPDPDRATVQNLEGNRPDFRDQPSRYTRRNQTKDQTKDQTRDQIKDTPQPPAEPLTAVASGKGGEGERLLDVIAGLIGDLDAKKGRGVRSSKKVAGLAAEQEAAGFTAADVREAWAERPVNEIEHGGEGLALALLRRLGKPLGKGSKTATKARASSTAPGTIAAHEGDCEHGCCKATPNGCFHDGWRCGTCQPMSPEELAAACATG